VLLQEGEETADNEGMDKKSQLYQELIKNMWTKVAGLKRGEALPHETFSLGVQADRKEHIQTAYFFRHIYKNHTDIQRERSRGFIAIEEADFLHIPNIISYSDFVIKNIKHGNERRIVYAQYNKGTYVYVAMVNDRENKNTSVTFYRFKKEMKPSAILNALKNNDKYDVSNAEIIIGSGGGGYPTETVNNNGAEANSAHPADTSLSP
jgi:hypothetical protein